MPISNLNITKEKLNSDMSELLLDIAEIKKKFDPIIREVGNRIKKANPLSEGALKSITAFMEAVRDLKVDAAREHLETFPNVTDLSLGEVKYARGILEQALDILETPRESQFNPFYDWNRLEKLTNAIDEFRDKLKELRHI